jgi:hypothetical protein
MRVAAAGAAGAGAGAAGGRAGLLLVAGLLVVAANLLFGLYSAPRFALPGRFGAPAAGAGAGAGAEAARAGRRTAAAAASAAPRRASDLAGAAAAAAGAAAGAAGAAGASSSASSPAPPSRHDVAFSLMFEESGGASADPFVTREACFAQPDEAETCFYRGPLCYDGDKVVVAVRGEATRRGSDSRTSMCYDFRHFVASQSCGYNGPHKRDNLAPPVAADRAFLQDAVPAFVNGAVDHRWGPLGREVSFREVGSEVFEDPGAFNVSIHWLPGASGLDAADAEAAAASAGQAAQPPGSGGGGLYIGGLHHSWLDHTWHFAAAAMSLFDIKRYNRSEPDAGGAGGALAARAGAASGREARYVQGGAGTLRPSGAWAAPPMSYLLWAGNFRKVAGPRDLRTWIVGAGRAGGRVGGRARVG